MLDKVKLALRITSSAFDSEIVDLINSAKADLGIVCDIVDEEDELQRRAIITYCRCNFGQPDDYDRLKQSYDEQKSQLRANPTYRRID